MSIVLSEDRVSCCDHTAASVQRGVDAGFGNCYCLLFHDFVNGDSVNIRHLVEFINTDNSAIRKNHGTSLKSAFPGFLIGRNGSSKTDSRRSPTSCGNSKRCGIQDESKQLGFRSRWVTNHQNVDVTPQMCPVLQIFLLSTEQHQENGFFYMLVSINTWSK